MSLFNFILWDASPEITSIGPVSIRWYSLLFISGFLIGQQILIRIYKREGKNEKDVETLTIYMLVATIIGARLGHCLFYDAKYYFGSLEGLISIFKVWEGGLASHGAAIGILTAAFIYSRKATNQSFLYVIDRIVIIVALSGCLIRLGNLMNSEIIGKPTDAPYAFLFVHDAHDLIQNIDEDIIKDVKITQDKTGKPSVTETSMAPIDIKITFNKGKINKDSISPFLNKAIFYSGNGETSIYERMKEHVHLNLTGNPNQLLSPEISEVKNEYQAKLQAYAIPRHPSQLYESISSFLLFLFLLFVYSLTKEKTPEGRLFGLFLVILFSLRFIYEFQKENQSAFETGMIETYGINMGQLLSIPFVLAGVFFLLKSFKKKNEIV